MIEREQDRPECAYTPVRGSRSCRGCRFSRDPGAYDGICGLPASLHDRAVAGDTITLSKWTEMQIVWEIAKEREEAERRRAKRWAKTLCNMYKKYEE